MKPKTFDQVRSEFLELKTKRMTLRDIAALYHTLTFGDVGRILAGIEPKDPDKRDELGLAQLGTAPLCRKHGVVHVGRCPRPGGEGRDLFSMKPTELRRRFFNRETVQEGRKG